MADDAKLQSAAPSHLGRLSAAFACSPRGAGAEEKRKAASPMEAARSNLNRGEGLVCCSGRSHDLAGAVKQQRSPSLRRPISWRHGNGGASGTRTHVAAVQRRCSPAELWPHEKSKAVIPMTTAPATMATFLLGFRTNHRGPSPGNDQR